MRSSQTRGCQAYISLSRQPTMASLKSKTKASVLIQKFSAIGRSKEKEDSEEQHADIAYMVRTKDHSEVDLTSDAESDTDQENEVLSFLYHFTNLNNIKLK